jgi:hypothetical protein
LRTRTALDVPARRVEDPPAVLRAARGVEADAEPDAALRLGGATFGLQMGQLSMKRL